jgi:hypothetical protein
MLRLVTDHQVLIEGRWWRPLLEDLTIVVVQWRGRFGRWHRHLTNAFLQDRPDVRERLEALAHG